VKLHAPSRQCYVVSRHFNTGLACHWHHELYTVRRNAPISALFSPFG